MEVLVVRGRFHWGFAVRAPGQSAVQTPFLFPPPGTLIGALARAAGSADADHYGGLEREVRWAAFGYEEEIPGLPVASLVSVDITRHLVAPYVRKEYRKEEQYKFAAVPTGKVYAPAFRAVLFYFGERMSRLRDVAWGIFRIGNKESLFEVREVEICRVSKAAGSEVETLVYVPKDKAVPILPDRVVELKMWLREGIDVFVYAPRRLEKVPYKAVKIEFCGWEYVGV